MIETNGYPLLLRLQGRRCVVVGGGKVAARKVEGLLDAGALVTIISPQVEPSLLERASAGQVELRQTMYLSSMLAELRPLLVFAATNIPSVNQQVADEAQRLNILVNSVDDASVGDFMNMAVIRRASIAIGITTHGASPALSAHLKAVVSAAVGQEYALLVQMMGDFRTHAKTEILSESGRAAFYHSVLNSPILDLLRAGDEVQARAIFDSLWAEAERNL